VASRPIRFRALDPTAGPLAFTAIVDEGVALYRYGWRVFVVLSAVWFVPTYVLSFLPNVFLLADPPALFRPRAEQPSSVALSVLTLLFGVWFDAAVTLAAVNMTRGRDASAIGASVGALRRAATLTVAACAWLVLLSMLTVVSFLILPFVLVLGLGGLLPLGLLLVWARLPRRRTHGLRSVIMFLTPLGPAVYWFVSLVLWQPLIMLEGVGPLAAFGRSRELVRGRWFGAAVVDLLAGLIGTVLTFAPWLITAFVLQLAGITEGMVDDRPFAQLIYAAASALPTLVFAPLSPIILALLALHLRNLREGTDLHLRLDAATSIQPVEPVRVEQAHL
jgi:hypothetical protein